MGISSQSFKSPMIALLVCVFSSGSVSLAQIHIKEKVIITEDSLAANDVNSRSGPLELSTIWYTTAYGKISVGHCIGYPFPNWLCYSNGSRSVILDDPEPHDLGCNLCNPTYNWYGGGWVKERGFPVGTPVAMHVHDINVGDFYPVRIEEDPDPDPPNLALAYFVFAVGPQQEEQSVAVAVLEPPPCPTPIVDCPNSQPERWNRIQNLLRLREGEFFSGYDQFDEPFGPVPFEKCKDLDGPGHTLLPSRYYLDEQLSRYWEPLNDIQYILEACQDNQRWRFKLPDLRVPIFASFCSINLPTDKVNLGDGSDESLLQAHINNDDDYAEVMKALNWCWLGPRYFKKKMGEGHPEWPGEWPKYIFDAGVNAHEDKHVDQLNVDLEAGFNKAFDGIFGIDYTTTQQPCQTWAIEDKKEEVKKKLLNAWRYANDKVLEKGSDKFQAAADESARSTYKEISDRIEQWWTGK